MGLPHDLKWEGDVATFKAGWNACLADPAHRRAALYYEAHITIDPVEEWKRPMVEELARRSGFKLAKLLMDKGVPSQLDTFMTSHSKDFDDITHRTKLLVCVLFGCGFPVRRYKIEDTLLDSRHSDVFNLLGK